jgi:hypothetical protein
MAKAMVRFRGKSGPLTRVEKLLAARGVSKNKLEKLRPGLRQSAAEEVAGFSLRYNASALRRRK